MKSRSTRLIVASSSLAVLGLLTVDASPRADDPRPELVALTSSLAAAKAASPNLLGDASTIQILLNSIDATVKDKSQKGEWSALISEFSTQVQENRGKYDRLKASVEDQSLSSAVIDLGKKREALSTAIGTANPTKPESEAIIEAKKLESSFDAGKDAVEAMKKSSLVGKYKSVVTNIKEQIEAGIKTANKWAPPATLEEAKRGDAKLSLGFTKAASDALRSLLQLSDLRNDVKSANQKNVEFGSKFPEVEGSDFSFAEKLQEFGDALNDQTKDKDGKPTRAVKISVALHDLCKGVSDVLSGQYVAISQIAAAMYSASPEARAAAYSESSSFTLFRDYAVKFLESESKLDRSLGINKPVSELRNSLTETLGTMGGVIAVYNGALAMVDDGLMPDAKNFVTDEIRLFYYANVIEVMRVINGSTALSNPESEQIATDAVQARSALMKVIDDLSDKNRELADLKSDLDKVQTKIKDAQRKAQASARILERAKGFELAAQRNLDDNAVDIKSVDEEITRVTNDSDLSAETKKRDLARLNRSKARLEKSKTRLDQEKADKATATANAATAATSDKEALDATEKKDGDLQSRMETLLGQVRSTQREASRLRTEIRSQGENEVELFAKRRDNGPVYIARPIMGSQSPLTRVKLTGYPDRSIIMIRGNSKDVEYVKEAIALFDKPAPQARITLYTLQLNSSNPGKLNSAMEKIDKRLRELRSNIAGVQDLLRQSITNEINRTARIARKVSDAQLDNRIYRSFFYPSEIRRRLGHFEIETQSPSEQRFRKAALAVDIDDTITLITEAKSIAGFVPIDGSGGALGLDRRTVVGGFARAAIRLQHIYREAKAVVADEKESGTAASDLQTAISALADQFESESNEKLLAILEGIRVSSSKGLVALRPQMDKLVLSLAEVKTKLSDDKCKLKLIDPEAAFVTKFTLPDPLHATTLGEMIFVTSLGSRDSRDRILKDFNLLLSLSDNFKSIGEKVRAEKRESDIVSALRGSINLVAPSESDGELTANQQEIVLALESQGRSRVAAEVKGLCRQIDVAGPGSATDEMRAKVNRLLDFLDPESLARRHYLSLKDADSDVPPGSESDQLAWEIASLWESRNPLSRSTPRVAAADDMIKRLIELAENDIERFFTEDTLKGIRRDVEGQGVTFGTMQRESVLATNRLIARVDPSASADLELKNGTNFLEAASQLGSIGQSVWSNQISPGLSTSAAIGVAGTLKGKGLGRARLNPSTIFSAGGLLGLFDILSSQPTEDRGEIYSINSGAQFKITPIFDPSGQALRFKFDYQASVNVQEPSGTTNRQIPRIERHAVNTEVQLSNLEWREISRFETNSKIGLPVERRGGLPILKEIPILRDIPLIGYYYRRQSSAAQRQESLIFAQTSIYPTVADIANLLVDVPARPYSVEVPEYVKRARAAAKEKSGGTTPKAR